MSAPGAAPPALAGSPPLVALGCLPERGAPTAFAAAAGCRIEAADGRRFLDLHNGAGTVLLGHAHPAVTAAVLRAVRAGRAHASDGAANRRSSNQPRSVASPSSSCTKP